MCDKVLYYDGLTFGVGYSHLLLGYPFFSSFMKFHSSDNFYIFVGCSGKERPTRIAGNVA